MADLAGQVAVVAGATRGAGRGIATMLGERGATVYCTGRTTRTTKSPIGRPETIEETAEEVTSRGGKGIAVRVDHTVPAEVEALFERVKRESGKLDILINDIGGENEAEWARPWEADVSRGLAFIETAVNTHIITARYGLPLMLETGTGLVVEITDGDHAGYRGAFFYDIVKNQNIRIAFALAEECARKGITVVAVTPGFLRSEMMLDNFGVTEANWRDAIDKATGFSESETPYFVGRCIASLAADPAVAEKSGGVYSSWNLAEEYDIDDVDGRRPHWGRYVESSLNDIIEKGGPGNDAEKYWATAWYRTLRNDPRHAELMARLGRVLS